MPMRRPTRPKGPSRAKHAKALASPMNTPLERSYAQMLRTDRKLTFESMASRAAFWANKSQQLQSEQKQEMDQSVAEISQGSLQQGTQFEAANIQSATLQSASPAQPGQSTIAGLGEGGIVPPPPAR